MFIIRRAQMEKFSEAAVSRFEGKLMIHLRTLFPRVCSRLGEQGVRDVIQHGIRRAAEYGIVRERDVSRYIGVMFMFGPEFDRKTKDFFHDVLRDPVLGAGARSNALCKAALSRLRGRTLQMRRKPLW